MNDVVQLPVKRPKRVRPPSRPKRWMAATSKALAALSAIREAADAFEEAVSEFRSVQEEYEEWKDNLPDSLQSSPLGEKLEEVCNLDLESQTEAITDAVSEVEGVIEEADAIDLPRGFGKD